MRMAARRNLVIFTECFRERVVCLRMENVRSLGGSKRNYPCIKLNPDSSERNTVTRQKAPSIGYNVGNSHSLLGIIFFFPGEDSAALELIPRESVGSPTLEIPKSWLDETLNKHGLTRPYSGQVVGPNDLQRSFPAWFCDSESDPTAGNGRTLAIMLGDGAVWFSDSCLGWSHWWIHGFSWPYVNFMGSLTATNFLTLQAKTLFADSYH